MKYLVFTFLLIISKVFAQDAHLSQYFVNPMLINPAQTGVFDGDYKLYLQQRDQWRPLMTKSIQTSSIGYEQPYRNFGFGGFLLNSGNGLGYKVMNALASASYLITIDPSGIHNLTTGVQLGVVYHTVNFNDLSYENQYVIEKGDFDKSIDNGERFARTTSVKPQANMGIYYHQEDVTKNYHPHIGIAGFNLIAPNQSFYQDMFRMSRRWVMSAGTKILYHQRDYIHPMLLVQTQANVTSYNVGVLGSHFLSGSNVYIYGGPFYRGNDAFILQAGVIYKDYSFGFSYDATTSNLGRATNYRGAFEISLVYSRHKATFLPSF